MTSKDAVKSRLMGENIIADATDSSRELYDKSGYGALLEDRKIQFSLLEGLYLLEKKKVAVLDGRGKGMSADKFILKARKLEPNFLVRYAVFKDLRNRGYVVKTALKFGADFRVYDRGVKPGEDHARWVVYPVHEGSTLTWHEFAAKNRVAHSTKKRLLLGVVDDENCVNYWEVRWLKP